MGLSLGWGWRDRLARVGMNLGRGESGGGKKAHFLLGLRLQRNTLQGKERERMKLLKTNFTETTRFMIAQNINTITIISLNHTILIGITHFAADALQENISIEKLITVGQR